MPARAYSAGLTLRSRFSEPGDTTSMASSASAGLIQTVSGGTWRRRASTSGLRPADWLVIWSPRHSQDETRGVAARDQPSGSTRDDIRMLDIGERNDEQAAVLEFVAV